MICWKILLAFAGECEPDLRARRQSAQQTNIRLSLFIFGPLVIWGSLFRCCPFKKALRNQPVSGAGCPPPQAFEDFSQQHINRDRNPDSGLQGAIGGAYEGLAEGLRPEAPARSPGIVASSRDVGPQPRASL